MARRFGCAGVAVVASCGLIAVVVLAANHVPAKKRALLNGFGANPRIEGLEITGRGDDLPFPFGEPYRAYGASFRIARRPGTRIILAAPRPDLVTGSEHVFLDTVGPFSWAEGSRSEDGTYSMRAVNVGAASDGPLPPFRVASVDDVIDRYDELIAYLAGQPEAQTYRSKEDGREWTRTIRRRE